MDNNGKRYDFERTCMNDKQADYVINAVKEEYENRPDWKIGNTIKQPLSNGEVKVIVELTKLDLTNERGHRM